MANVRRVDRGWLKIKANMAALGNRGVKVGLLAGGPSQDGTPVVHYATWNEFGTDDGRIPARPFMRTTAYSATRDVRNSRGLLAVNLRKMIRSNLSPDQILDGLGLWYQARIRETIRNSKRWARPNSAFTISQKGSSVPLIEHGILIGAVNYEKTTL